MPKIESASGSFARKSVVFGASMFVLAASSLVVMPEMIRSAGLDGWGAIATGQSIGAFGAVIINWGWSFTGTSAIASSADLDHRGEVLAAGLIRGVICIPAAVGVAIAAVSVSDTPKLCLAGALAALPAGLSFNWYFIGANRPLMLFCLETIPRVSTNLVAALALSKEAITALGATWLVCGASALASVSSFIYLMRTLPKGSSSEFRLWRELARRRHGMTANMSSSALAALPVVIVNALAPQAVGAYALVDRPFRQILAAMSVLTDVMQGAIGDRRRPDIQRRIRQMVQNIGILTLPTLCISIVPSWLLLSWLGHGKHYDWISASLLSTLVVLSFADGIAARALMPPLGLTSQLARISMSSSAVGVLAVALGAVLSGANGALVGLSASITLKLIRELLQVLRQTKAS